MTNYVHGGDIVKLGLQESELKMLIGTEAAVLAACILVQGRAKNTVRKKTGLLRRSITYDLYYSGTSKLVGEVGTNVKYGPFIEFGTKKNKAYPFLLPAIENNKAQMISVMTKAFMKAAQ